MNDEPALRSPGWLRAVVSITGLAVLAAVGFAIDLYIYEMRLPSGSDQR